MPRGERESIFFSIDIHFSFGQRRGEERIKEVKVMHSHTERERKSETLYSQQIERRQMALSFSGCLIPSAVVVVVAVAVISLVCDSVAGEGKFNACCSCRTAGERVSG